MQKLPLPGPQPGVDASLHLGGPVPISRLLSHLLPVARVENALTRFEVITIHLSEVDAGYQSRKQATAKVSK